MRQFGFKIMNGKELWMIDCDSVSMETSNGAKVVGIVENNTAIFDCSEELSSQEGTFLGKIEFVKGVKR